MTTTTATTTSESTTQPELLQELEKETAARKEQPFGGKGGLEERAPRERQELAEEKRKLEEKEMQLSEEKKRLSEEKKKLSEDERRLSDILLPLQMQSLTVDGSAQSARRRQLEIDIDIECAKRNWERARDSLAGVQNSLAAIESQLAENARQTTLLLQQRMLALKSAAGGCFKICMFVCCIVVVYMSIFRCVFLCCRSFFVLLFIFVLLVMLWCLVCGGSCLVAGLRNVFYYQITCLAVRFRVGHWGGSDVLLSLYVLCSLLAGRVPNGPGESASTAGWFRRAVSMLLMGCWALTVIVKRCVGMLPANSWFALILFLLCLRMQKNGKVFACLSACCGQGRLRLLVKCLICKISRQLLKAVA